MLHDGRPDLLPHKVRPINTVGFGCHPQQASRLKQWVQEFNNRSQMSQGGDESYDSSDTESSLTMNIASKCALLTGPPGVGKTSLVYSTAQELDMHVVESHPSDKRDGKLFSRLKLTNQKGKIDTNPIARMFQAIQQKQSHRENGRRKRRKLAESTNCQIIDNNHPTQCLSLSDNTSIILFDDIDVVFEEDGPFLKSLVEFIKESKRPVVVTATQSIEYIRKTLLHYEHIHLNKPPLDDCARLLKNICKREKYYKLGTLTKCTTIADQSDCDIRQCLNRIHFYGDKADRVSCLNSENYQIFADYSKLNLSCITDNKSLLDCYTTCSIVDLMDSQLDITDKMTKRERWLDGKPSQLDEHYFDHDLGEKIRESIIELTKNLRSNELMTEEQSVRQRRKFHDTRDEFLSVSHLVNERIKSRIEPPEREYYTEILPLFSEVAKLEMDKRPCPTNGGSFRRSRRALSYLDSIQIYLEPDEVEKVSRLAADANTCDQDDS